MSHKKKSTTPRKTWQGLYVRKTKTKKEKLENMRKKYKKDLTSAE